MLSVLLAFEGLGMGCGPRVCLAGRAHPGEGLGQRGRRAPVPAPPGPAQAPAEGELPVGEPAEHTTHC